MLVRDLAQVASPAGSEAPLRGRALGDVEVVENAYVLCIDGRIEDVGPMRSLRSLDGEVEEIDGSGLSAVPGLVDCHTHACFAGDRVEEFAMRAAGATYEELHAAGGGIVSTVRRRVPPARRASPRRRRATESGCGARARRRGRRSRATGSTDHRARPAADRARRRRRRDVPRPARGPARVRRHGRLRRVRAR